MTTVSVQTDKVDFNKRARFHQMSRWPRRFVGLLKPTTPNNRRQLSRRHKSDPRDKFPCPRRKCWPNLQTTSCSQASLTTTEVLHSLRKEFTTMLLPNSSQQRKSFMSLLKNWRRSSRQEHRPLHKEKVSQNADQVNGPSPHQALSFAAHLSSCLAQTNHLRRALSKVRRYF